MAIALDVKPGKHYDRERSWRELGTAYVDALAFYYGINPVRAAQYSFINDNTQDENHTPEHVNAAA